MREDINMSEEDVDEVFKNPSVIEVVFEVRFPTLFYIAQRIGDFQVDIMDIFPKSSEIIEQPFVISRSDKTLPEELPKPTPIWQFESDNGKTKIIIRPNRLNISSQEYISYNNPEVDNKFRDLINKIMHHFLERVPMKKFSRIGIRYIDRCPLELLTNVYFKNYYKPVINIDKYCVENIQESQVLIRTKMDDYFLLFQCAIKQVEDKYYYFLDYDGYANDIEVEKYLAVTDKLQKAIKKEYLNHITEEFKTYMRGDVHER